MMNKHTLVLFTNTFPYGMGESFLETEIKYLAKEFDKIIIYPIKKDGEKRELPLNVEISSDFIIFKVNSFSPKKTILKNILLISIVLWNELVVSKKRKLFYKKFKVYFNILIYRIACSELLIKEFEKFDSENVVFYSYWFNQWSSLLCLMTNRKKIKVQQRIHGYDYDPIRYENGFIPFRKFEMTRIDRLFPASNYAVNVIKNSFPNFKKIHLSKLGVSSGGINPANYSDTFKIVSCSNIISLKRVNLIVEVLSYLKVKTNWTHFGDGDMKAEIESKIKSLSDNVSVVLKGQEKNSDILKFYKYNSVDLFITFSEIEGGVPVSIMEAISFGIPCVGCDIGGVNEIVNSNTGFLFKKDFSPKHVASILEKYFLSTEESKMKLRISSREFWKENYSAEKNYTKHIKILKK